MRLKDRHSWLLEGCGLKCTIDLGEVVRRPTCVCEAPLTGHTTDRARTTLLTRCGNCVRSFAVHLKRFSSGATASEGHAYPTASDGASEKLPSASAIVHRAYRLTRGFHLVLKIQACKL